MDILDDKVKFDPGYAPLIIESFGQVGYLYYIFSSISDKRIKKINFNSIHKKLEEHLLKNISFYFGCLLWGCYIVEFENNKEIVGNKLLGEASSEEEYTSEIVFLIDFVKNKFPRDYKYFLSKNYNLDERFLPILETYKEFLILNKGFCDCSNTNLIILPSNLKKINENKELVENVIKKAIEDEDIVSLLDNNNIYNIIF